MEIKAALNSIIEGNSLSFDDAYLVATQLMEGKATDAQIAALLVGLRMKLESVDEISAFSCAMRDKVLHIPCSKNNLVDSCGTGGDGSGTFNISTVSALVATGAGCKVAKHGNRAITSQCGSADILKALGINIDITPDKMAQCIDNAGIGFLFAPVLHPAMKYAIGPRCELGIRTIFNILGPLTNPAGAKRQLLGVFSQSLTDVMAAVLQKMGSEHVMVVHGADGLDEITLTDKTYVSELKAGNIKSYTIQPADYGFSQVPLSELKGGTPENNTEITMNILKGHDGPPRDIVLLNAGAVIYVSGKADSIEEGVLKAKKAIDSGAALQTLENLKTITNM